MAPAAHSASASGPRPTRSATSNHQPWADRWSLEGSKGRLRSDSLSKLAAFEQHALYIVLLQLKEDTATDLPDDPRRTPEISWFSAILNEYLAEYSNLVECEWHSGYYSSSASGTQATQAATHRGQVAPFQAELVG